ncbi:MAG: type III pantothenate kinase [Clostridia bacterium]|nr:type III pantothenate kinase [Clostridia bacterium]MBP5593198.1 type III pantothenate kinase [Clostridia bacterium]MBP5648661.1 type III pantothenate kinase [Clostridia bacterium]
MLLAIDIGNTNIKIGVFEKNNLVHSLRLSTMQGRTGDEYGLDIISQLATKGIKKEEITGAIMSSVNPNLNYTLEHACDYFLGIKPIIIGPGVKTGLNIKYDNPKEVGSDRIVNSVAAYNMYGGPCIVVDCGTATTFNVINERGDFLGGCIGYGLKNAAEALSNSAAKLPKIELNMPDSVVCKSTITNMQAGLIQGYIGMIERIVSLIKEETGFSEVKVIATGGIAEIVKKESDVIDILDRRLTLKGLSIIYNMNAKNMEKQA